MAMSIRLTTEEEARLTRLAERTGRSKSFYVREAIQKHLAELEEKYWEDEVIREWEAAGKPRSSAAELWNELGV